MQSLSGELRNQLAAAVKAARRAGEAGARSALVVLAVRDARAHPSLSPDEQDLRRRLRAHGRQLGDRLDAETGVQQVERLVQEVAYEHWHRMLFARFLAENDLLIEPDSGVAVSLTDCEELARERGQDCWTVAGRFAERMLPRIFRSDDSRPRRPPGARDPAGARTAAGVAAGRRLRGARLAGLDLPVLAGRAERGRQQERRQDRRGRAAGGDAALHRALHGAVPAAQHRRRVAGRQGPGRAAGAGREPPRARTSCAGPYGWRRPTATISRTFDSSASRAEDDEEDQPTGPWRPAAGTFAGWPRSAADLRVLDPCCGSGHFLVECLDLLARLRMEEERLAPDYRRGGGAAGQPVRAGDRPALHPDRRVQPRLGRLDVARRRRAIDRCRR